MDMERTISMHCIMGKLDHPNHNGRIYDSKMMEEAIKKWKNEGSKISEFNPDYGTISHFTEPRISEAAGKIEDIWIENNEVVGKVQLLDTPTGRLAQSLDVVGRELKLGPRMLGENVPVLDEEGKPTYDENGNQICEVKNVKLISFDLV